MLTSIRLTNQKDNHKPTMQIAIFGIGALGCLLGAKLSPHAAVTLVGNWQTQIDKLRQAPLRYLHPDGNGGEIQLDVTDNPSTILPVDIAIVATKSPRTGQIAPLIPPILKSDGIVITLQNGLGNREILAEYSSETRCTQGVTTMGATLLEAGVIRFANVGHTTIATHPAIEAKLRALLAIMQAAQLSVELTSNIKPAVWEKLAVNAAINPLTAILRVPNGELLQSAWARQTMHDVATEISTLAASQWLSLPHHKLITHIEHIAQQTAYNRSSMLQDVERQAETEIEAICGVLVRLAETVGVPMPVTATLYRLVKTIENLYGVVV